PHAVLRHLPPFPTRRSSDLLAAAFHAERVVRARGLARVDVERGQVVRPRDGVIHERPGDELARLVVAAVLGERLADALGEPAVQDRKSTRLNSSHVKISYAV